MLKIQLILLLLVLGIGYYLLSLDISNSLVSPQNITNEVFKSSPTPLPTPSITLITPLSSKTLPNDYYIRQSFNNCGPAALSMALSYYGVSQGQDVLGQALRPYQHPTGNNDDKSVTLEELAEKSKDYGFTPFFRPNGTIGLIKLFISYDMPIITRTSLSVGEDIGHYRIIKGYDETSKTILQDDSLQYRNYRYSYSDFNAIWEGFNNEYLVLVPNEKLETAYAIIGEDVDPKIAWGKMVKKYQQKLDQNPNDEFSRFNLSVAYYNIGDYQNAVNEFEKVESRLPARTLWYQIEPIKAYYEVGNHQRVRELTSRILNNNNRAFSELYIIRGQIYQKEGNTELAKVEFEKAVLYNRNLQSAQEALNNVR